jgi:putative transposase
MGPVAIYQRPNTSKPAAAHKVYPYLLGRIAIERVNQVWCSDITYIPMANGFLYLVVIMDWVSRAVLAWRLSNTLGTEFCVDALEEALSQHGPPEIFNTDQSLPQRRLGAASSPATASPALWGPMTSRSAWKGRCMDNIFVEQLWRSLIYEEVYLRAYATVAAWINFYNDERQHQSLGYPSQLGKRGNARLRPHTHRPHSQQRN